MFLIVWVLVVAVVAYNSCVLSVVVIVIVLTDYCDRVLILFSLTVVVWLFVSASFFVSILMLSIVIPITMTDLKSCMQIRQDENEPLLDLLVWTCTHLASQGNFFVWESADQCFVQADRIAEHTVFAQCWFQNRSNVHVWCPWSWRRAFEETHVRL